MSAAVGFIQIWQVFEPQASLGLQIKDISYSWRPYISNGPAPGLLYLARGWRPLVFKGPIVVYICIYEFCFLYCYCICIIYACSSLVEEIKNIIIIIIIICLITSKKNIGITHANHSSTQRQF